MELDKWTKLGKALMDAVERLPLEWDLYINTSCTGVDMWLENPHCNELRFNTDVPVEKLADEIVAAVEFARVEYAKELAEVERRAEGRSQ